VEGIEPCVHPSARRSIDLAPSTAWRMERDPSALLAVSTERFRACGRTVGALGLQTLLAQEGGYALDALGTNLLAFLDGFGDARR